MDPLYVECQFCTLVLVLYNPTAVVGSGKTTLIFCTFGLSGSLSAN